MKDIKNLIITALAVVVVAGGIYALVPSDEAVVTDPVVIESGQDGIDGPRGYQGSQGVQGPQGTQGIQGVAGEDGADATFNLSVLTDAVIDEMEDREDRITYGFSGVGGNYSYSFDIEDEDVYEFTIRHFGSGDFDVSIEDEDGNISILVDSNGHLGYNDTRTLSPGEYLVKVSADGSWEIEIEEK